MSPDCAFPTALFLLALSSAACSDAGSSDALDGEAVYANPLESGNTFACATCHALDEPTSDGFTRPGHPIGDAPRRSSFKNGQLSTFLEATNTCLTEWMNAEPWTEESGEYQALRDYLLEAGAEVPVTEVSIQLAPLPDESVLLAGDPQAGRETFNQTCVVCHGVDGVGTERAPRVSGFELSPATVARRVRTSGSEASVVYDGLTGGRMPFWGSDRLSDEQLSDISAYLAMGEVEDSSEPDETARPSDPPAGLSEARSCAATHGKVGQQAELVAFAHGVAGNVEIVDDCTLEFRNFTFDGQGINVQLYVGSGGQFTYSISGDIRREVGYAGSTFRVNLPEGLTLDEVDAVSVWCVPVGVSFGDGAFL